MSQLLDLSTVPVPDVIENRSFDEIKFALLDDLRQRMQAAKLPFDAERVQSEPLVINEHARAWREYLLHARINDAVRAVLVASAQGADLEAVVADFNLTRRVLIEATDSEPAVLESYEELRQRRQHAPHQLAVGSLPGYAFNALEADASLIEAKVKRVQGNEMSIGLLSRYGDGSVSMETIERVSARLAPRGKYRLGTDDLRIFPASIHSGSIVVEIEIGAGPDAAIVEQQALQGVEAQIALRRGIGSPLNRDAIIGGAHRADEVRTVRASSDLFEFVPGAFDAIHVTNIDVRVIRV
ncbi:MAG: baseplate J/gp47 family protein [Pseudomonadota bacterium]